MAKARTLSIPVGEHIYVTPPVPDKKDIAYSDLPKSEQYWRRQKDIPQLFYDWNPDVIEGAKETEYERKVLISLSAEDLDMVKFYQDREFQRMTEGFWFMNDGEPTYLTGPHYAMLQWCALYDNLNTVEPGSQYGAYMQFQRNFAYFVDMVENNPKVIGGNNCKSKKTGITMEMGLIMLIKCITTRNKIFRIMSTKEEVAKRPNFYYITFAVDRLPAILTPEFRKNLGAIFFENTDSSTKKSSAKKRTDIIHQNSYIETVPTIVDGFDSGKNRIAWIDEHSKIEIPASNLEQLHNITAASVRQGALKVGFMMLTHYVTEKNNSSFKEAKTIWNNGKLSTMVDGETTNGLINYAMFASEGIFGCCDKYGKPILTEIYKFINNEIAKLKNNTSAIRAFRRQYPMNEEDMWQVGAGELGIFDNFRLGIKYSALTKERDFSNFWYTPFNFQWVNGDPVEDEYKSIYKYSGQVQLVPTPLNQIEKALFKWYHKEWTPDHWLRKYVNKIGIDKYGNYIPNPQSPFFGAMDPTQYSNKKDVVTGSKNAFQIFLMPNGELDSLIGKKVSNKRLMVEYLHRPESPKDTLMHAIQVIFYFGCYFLIEANAAWLATKLKERGFANFLIMVNEETGVLEPYKRGLKQKFYTTQRNKVDDTIGEYMLAGMNHYSTPSTDMDIDNVDYLDSIDVIEQLMEFDPNNTTKFDAAVCHLIGQHGMNAYMGWKERDYIKNLRHGDGTMRALALALN